MDFEEVKLLTEDNVKLKGILLKPKPDQILPIVIFFHGVNGGLEFGISDFKQIATALNVNVFVIFYRGYDLSEGTPTEAGIKIDA